MTRRRSWLIVPGDRPDSLRDATRSGPDVIVLDLHDTVHPARVAEARGRLVAAAQLVSSSGAQCFVRGTVAQFDDDLLVRLASLLDGIALADEFAEADVMALDQRLGRAEQGTGRADGRIEIHLCLETARTNLRGETLITASPRVRSVSLGRADLVMGLGTDPTGDIHLMPYLAERLVLMARAAGVLPIGGWWTADSRGLSAGTEATSAAAYRGRSIGFRGTMCVDPDQVAAINTAFDGACEEHR